MVLRVRLVVAWGVIIWMGSMCARASVHENKGGHVTHFLYLVHFGLFGSSFRVMTGSW